MYSTQEQDHLREQVRQFAAAEIAPRVPHIESSGQVERDLVMAIAQQGWMGVTISPPYGGMDAGHVAKTIIIEELSQACGAIGAAVQASQLGSAPILYGGSEEQKRTWLPQIADGSCLPTIAVTERGSGGHVLGMQMTARREGNEYVLTGHKLYVGNSHIGHLHCIVARTGNPSQHDDHNSRSLSAFLVEGDRPGLSLTPYRQALGLHGFSFGEIVLDNCRIPAANLIGEEGDGLATAYFASVVYGRPNLTAVALGLQQAIVAETVTFAQERRRYNGSLAVLPTIQQKLALMQHRLMTTRLTAYDAVERLDKGVACDPELMNAKYGTVEATLDSVRTAMEIHAAAGLQRDLPLERLARDAYCTYAPAGTGDIQLLRLAETALNIPRSQWSQRLPK